ncbi:MAG: hypothetical protein ACOX65_13305 [Anaerotruncus rubiinfantis]|jgi:hypothetical protein
MNSSVINRIRRLVIGLLIIGLPAVPAFAETEGFFSNAGIFEWFVPPEVRPQKNVQPSDGWMGVYYAPGVGLEMNIWDLQEGEGVLHFSIVNYANPNETVRNRINDSLTPVDGGMQSPMGGVTLHDFHDGTFTMDITDEWAQWLDSRETPIFGNPRTIVFTDVTKLMADPVEDRYGGAYFLDEMEDHNGVQVYSGNTFFLSFVQLYGTSDYFLVKQREVDGRALGNTSIQTVFLVGSGDELIHNYGYSIVTGKDYVERYVLHDVTPQSYVTQYAGDDGNANEYYWCSNKTMWGD